jgi:hypothetical protein
MNLTDENNLFSQEDNLIMISGFFTALNSFSDSFEDLGAISELKLTNNNLKLSFLRNEDYPNLIFLCSFNDDEDITKIQTFLRDISLRFVQVYNIEQIMNWNGKKEFFNSFSDEIKKSIETNKKVEEDRDTNKAFEFLNSFIKEDIEDLHSVEDETLNEEKILIPEYYSYIPAFTSNFSNTINPHNYLSGEISCKVYEQIDGVKSINQIATDLNLNHNQVFSSCKNLIKIGFINFMQ